MLWAGYEPAIPVLHGHKRVDTSDRATTVLGTRKDLELIENSKFNIEGPEAPLPPRPF
jgi:hypothetical protein